MTDIAWLAFTIIVTAAGVALCVFVFMGLAALGHFWRMNARPVDDRPARPWLWEGEE